MRPHLPITPKTPRNIVEIHIDSCAQLGSSSIHAVQALKELYDAIGHKKLVYIETEQGLREKTNRTNYTMWKTLKSDNTTYDTFLGLQDSTLEIHATAFCLSFEKRFSDYIFPQMVKPLLQEMDEMHRHVKQCAYKIIEKNDPEKLHAFSIRTPDDIPFKFSEKMIEKNGKRFTKTALEPFHIREKDTREERHIDALELALRKVHEKYWTPKTSRSRNADNTVFGDKSSEYGSFFSLIHQHQLLGAIAAQLAFTLAPDHMEKAGYERSPLAHLGEKQFDSRVIEKNAHLFPTFSILHPPISDIKDASLRQNIVMQSLKLTGFWPWIRKKELGQMHRDALQKAHHNCADHAILYYFTDILPEKSDAAHRHFIVVTHDAPLIQQFAEFSSGHMAHEKRKPILATNKNNGKETRTKHKSAQQISRPLSQDHYKFIQPDGSIITLSSRPSNTLPSHAVLTGKEFMDFVAHELDDAKRLYRDESNTPPKVRVAMDAVRAAHKHLSIAAMSDKQPGRIVTERVLLERLAVPSPVKDNVSIQRP